MRLIDADELIKQACRSTEWSHGEHPLVIEADDIDDAPTVDAEPVMHAHVVWTIKNSSYQTQCCSNCHRTFISRPDETIEFCPHCGAKIDDHEGELK